MPTRRRGVDWKALDLSKKREPTQKSQSPRTTGASSWGRLFKVVLAVAVELHSDVVALPLGVQVARLDGAANAQVLQQADVVDAVFPADAGCAVCGAVVDDHVIQLVGAGFAVLPHPGQ